MKPNIVVSLQDLERLKANADALPASAPGKETILEELPRATIVEANEMPSTVVKRYSTALFCIDDADKVFVLRLVYPHEVDQFEDAISVLSPVGTALLGMPVGSCITSSKPDGDTMDVRVPCVDGWCGHLHPV